MLTTVVSVALVLGVLAYVALPLVRGAAGFEDEAVAALSPLERQKLEAYAAIKEAEFDRQTGKLSEADFAALTAKYRQQALAAIAALEEAHRRTRQAGPRGSRSPQRFAFCPACGERVAPRANFCGACGTSVRDAAA